jgi:hypothetical protein
MPMPSLRINAIFAYVTELIKGIEKIVDRLCESSQFTLPI